MTFEQRGPHNPDVCVAVLSLDRHAPNCREARHHVQRFDLNASPQRSANLSRWAMGGVRRGDAGLGCQSKRQQIWIVPAAGGDSRQITAERKGQRPRWSPDGKKIAFLSSRKGAPQIYSIPLDGGEPTQSLPFQRARTMNCGRPTESGSLSSPAFIPIARMTPATPGAMRKGRRAK